MPVIRDAISHGQGFRPRDRASPWTQTSIHPTARTRSTKIWIDSRLNVTA